MSDGSPIALNANCPCGSMRPFKSCHGQFTTIPIPALPPREELFSVLGTDGKAIAAGLSKETAMAMAQTLADEDGWSRYIESSSEKTQVFPKGMGIPGPQRLQNVTERKDDLPKAVEAPVAVAEPGRTLRLDLACGQTCQPGFEGVDIWDGAQHCINLMRFPWPFESDSVSEIHCSHFIEHIPMIFVDAAGFEVPMGVPGGRDAFFAFMDECYRILKKGAWARFIVPAHRSDRAFQDPTHRRFITAQTFLYLNKEWRTLNKLDHYNVKCDFSAATIEPTVIQEISLLSPQAAQRRMNGEWNVIHDWVATIRK